MDWMLGIAVLAFVLMVLIYAYTQGFNDGYRAGRRSGFEDGKRAINEYVVKINHALGERIEEINRGSDVDED